MWSLNIKVKHKHFLWKWLNNILPVKEVVQKRTRKCNNICCGCGEVVETVEHLFLLCPIAERVWKLASVNWDGLKSCQHNFWRWWQAVMQSATKERGLDHVHLTVNILWQLWKSRNRIVIEKEQLDALRLIQKAHREWMEFDTATAEEKENRSRVQTLHQYQRSWEPPKEGIVKINIDAAISSHMVRTGKCIIARNWTGKIIRAEGLVEQKKRRSDNGGSTSSENCIKNGLKCRMDKNRSPIKLQNSSGPDFSRQ